MPSYGGFQPIYQYYLDAQKTRAETQRLQTDTALDRLKGVIEINDLNQQMQERQIVQQVWGQQGQGQQQQPGVFDPAAAGGSTPNANPSTGDDPSMQTAARMDAVGTALLKVPGASQRGLEWLTKASTLRDQYYTRQTRQLDMQKKQGQLIVDRLGTVEDGDQAGYTQALMSLHDAGINISQLGLSGNVDTDRAVRGNLVKQSMTFAEKAEAQKTAFTQTMETNKFADQQRHEGVTEAQGWANVNVKQSSEAFRESHDKIIENFKAKEDARAQAGVARNDAATVQKLKDLAMRPDPGGADAVYASNIVKADPALSALGSSAQKAAANEIMITARRKLADRITKPTDAPPTADDFLNEVQKAAAAVAKRVQTKKAFGYTYGADLAPRQPTATAGRAPSAQTPTGTPPLPPTITSQSQLAAKSAGDQVSINGKLYEVTKKGSKPDGSDTELEEIK